MKCWTCNVEVIGRNRVTCKTCSEYGPTYNLNPCHKIDPLVCVMPTGHDGECDDDEALEQFFSGGHGGRYV